MDLPELRNMWSNAELWIGDLRVSALDIVPDGAIPPLSWKSIASFQLPNSTEIRLVDVMQLQGELFNCYKHIGTDRVFHTPDGTV